MYKIGYWQTLRIKVEQFNALPQQNMSKPIIPCGINFTDT